MNFWDFIEAEISFALGELFTIRDHQSIGGGCINECWKISGERTQLFIKTNTLDKQDMFAAEAAGLETLGATQTVRVPRPLCSGAGEGRSYLVMEYIPVQPLKNAARFGEQLAAMHSQTQQRFGWHRDNTIGATPQPNGWSTDWVEFWQQKRLGFQLKLAAENGASRRLIDRGELLNDWLPRLFSGYLPKASPLHGDLWSGNWGSDEWDNPVIFDPATYFGDHETELAMMELFGGPGREFHAAYEAVLPLDKGYTLRRHLYNLYHTLNHFNLFGGGYQGQSERLIDRLLGELK